MAITFERDSEEISDPCDPPCGCRHYQHVGEIRYFKDGVQITREEAKKALGLE